MRKFGASANWEAVILSCEVDDPLQKLLSFLNICDSHKKITQITKIYSSSEQNCQHHQNNVPFQLNWQAILAACLLKISETSQSKNKVWVVSLNCILLFKWGWKKAELTVLCWRFCGELTQAVEFFPLENNCIYLQNFAHISGIHGSLKADPSTPNFEDPNM